MSTISGGEVSLAKASDQNVEYCGAVYPGFDLASQDPFLEYRYLEPADDMVAPFDEAQEAYDVLMASRPSCDQVSNQSTLLVSQKGEDDPRWQGGSFDDLYGTIQGAIDVADHCDTIIVRPGIYRENLSIEGKDVQIFSDTWNEDGTLEDGDERVDDYVAERIDLEHYYETGERIVTEAMQPYLQPLAWAERTILEGGGYAEGPTLGGILDDHHDDEDHDQGCGNRRPMVDFVEGTTRNTIFDGFTVRLMAEQDHTIPGHGHTLQARGGSPIIRHNIIYNNGSTGIGVHASFEEITPLTPACDYDSSLAQETFKNDDYRSSNIKYRPVPLIYDNISYQNNGLGLGNNHYSGAGMIGNEAFWNAVPGEEAEHQSPGIGNRHGAKTYLEYNVVYKNAWTGIAIRQGYLQPSDDCAADPQACNHIDERIQAVILHNIVFDNGFGETPLENQGGIAVDGAGLPDDPVLIKENVVFDTRVSGIAVRNEFAGEEEGFVMDDTYVEIVGNTVFSNMNNGITCIGSDVGVSECTVVGNDVYWNQQGGITLAEGSTGEILNNVSACNNQSGIVIMDAGTPVYNNISYFNVSAGIVDAGTTHDYNILSGNNSQDVDCGTTPKAQSCQKPQYAADKGGSGPGENDLFVDPLFSDVLNYDFTLQNGSPAIDSGVSIASYYPNWTVSGEGPDRGSKEGV